MLPKSDFLAQNFFNKSKKNNFGQKSPNICPKPSKYMWLGNVFSLFWLISYFWKFWHFWPKKSNFLAFLVKIFKNKKLIKKSEKTFPRYTYSDGFGKFLVIFVQKYFSYPC